MPGESYQPAKMPPYEIVVREFMRARGHDLDAQAVVFQIDRVSMDILAAMETEALRPLGLSRAGFVLLMTLLIAGPRETRELARIQRVSRPAIVSCVDTLERNGLVRRRRMGQDRRLVSVAITKAGRSLAEQAIKAWHACEQAVASVLTVEEQRMLADLLRKVACGAYGSGKLDVPVAKRPELWDPDREEAAATGGA
ncbi:MAG: MarR family winged helix-turn-helix transcriptional regulator [Dehalococcoidia bacterium]